MQHPRPHSFSRPSALAALLVCAAGALAPATARAQSSGFRIPFPSRLNPGGGGAPANATPFDLAIARGDQALRRGDYPAAQQQFEQAARLNPTDARPAFYLGEVAVRQGQWAVAERYLRTALQRNPRMAEAHAELGSVLRELGRNADAITPLETALRIDPQLGEAHFTLAMALEDAGQTERALSEYRSAVRLLPNEPMPALNLGILLANGRPAAGSAPRAEAFRMLQTAVRNANNNAAVFANAGPALRAIGEYALAAQTLERARQQSGGRPTAALLGELAQALWASGDRATAVARITEAVAADGRSAELRYVRALMLAEQGDRAGATSELRQVQQLAAGTPLAQRAQQRLTALQQQRATPPSGSNAPARR